MGTVTRWMGELKDGNHEAAARLWERYFEKLVRYARRKLQGDARRWADEEDVALEAFAGFCRGAAEGRYPNLADRDDLWRLLLRITACRAIDLMRRNRRATRRVHAESDVPGWDSKARVRSLDRVISDSPSPEVVTASVETCRRLLARLGDQSLRETAIAKLQGRTNEEIARDLGRSLRTIERKLGRIRNIWEDEIGRSHGSRTDRKRSRAARGSAPESR